VVTSEPKWDSVAGVISVNPEEPQDAVVVLKRPQKEFERKNLYLSRAVAAAVK
jgi:hypothetical protein